MRLLCLLIVAAGLRAQTTKPVCEEKTRGQYWPEAANQDPKALFELSRTGELEICTGHGKKKKQKFAWEAVGFHIKNQLPPPALAILAEPQKQK